MIKQRIGRRAARAVIAAALVMGLGFGSGLATPGLGVHGTKVVARHAGLAVAATIFGNGWLPIHDR